MVEKTDPPILSRIQVPVLSESTHKILKLLNDPSASSKDYAKLIMGDPGLTTKVLKLVNSSLYALRKRVGSIQDACVLLGLRNVRSLCLSSSLADEMKKEASQEITKCWRYSLMTGEAARRVASLVCPEAEGDVSTAGLLHAMGLIAMLGTEELDFGQVIDYAEGQGVDWIMAERHMLEFDHCEVGEAIARRWKLLDPVCSILGGWEDAEEANSPALFCVALASAGVQASFDEFRHFANPQAHVDSLAEFYPDEMELLEDKFDGVLEDAQTQLELLQQ